MGHRTIIAWGLASGLLAACAHSGPERPCADPPPLQVTFEADDRLNPDDKGRSLPTVVQLLQVKSPRRLEGADFVAVWQRPKEVFEEDLLRADELMIEPGKTDTKVFPRDPQAAYVVAVGVFRRPAGSSWRATQPLAAVPPERCGPTGVRTGTDDARFFFHDARVDVAMNTGASRGRGP